jgi:ketosteroid isomerase-like protein
MASEVEIARLVVEAYNAGDIERVLELADPEVTMVPVRSLLEGSEYRGHEGVRRFLADTEEDWASREIEVEEILQLDNGVLVLGSFVAVGHSGTEVRYPLAWHSVYRNGKLLRMTAYSDQQAARRELGLA